MNRADYSEEQLDAWACGSVNLAAWDRSFLEHETMVAERNGQIVGFGDLRADGYLDRLYVHKDAQRQGIAAAICDMLERSAGTKILSTHASITARGFFEKRGYKVVREQQVERCGVKMINYIMTLKG